jgi:hypothetical protein
MNDAGARIAGSGWGAGELLGIAGRGRSYCLYSTQAFVPDNFSPKDFHSLFSSPSHSFPVASATFPKRHLSPAMPKRLVLRKTIPEKMDPKNGESKKIGGKIFGHFPSL